MAKEPTPAEFDVLADARHRVQEFVVDHVVSVMSFHDEASGWFAHSAGQPIEQDERAVRHITTVHTCWESLLEDRRGLRVRSRVAKEYNGRLLQLEEFAALALSHPDAWMSEKAGYIYCRARSLGVITRYAPAAAAQHPENTKELLSQIWTCQPLDRRQGAYGAREVVEPPSQHPPQVADYPTNAYHTYWSTTALRRADDAWAPAEKAAHLKAGADRLRLIACEQMALLAADSSFADPQQLAWAINGIVYHANETDLVQGAQTYHIVQQGLRQFFAQQDNRGEWPRGAPLFNYGKGSGNAYCYVFETLGEMLAVATDPAVPEHEQFAAMLRPYLGNLSKLLEHADQTAIPLDGGGRGWVSGHRPNAHSAEAWATASIFRYAQRLRLLLGAWTNQVARRDLGARKATMAGNDLAERGATWNLGFGSAGTQLASNFALPTLATELKPLPASEHFTEDPDDVIVAEGAGRSAVLFGPPGTGKTTLVEALAGRLSWPFVEITPDMFLNRGMDMVSAQADQVFRRMMELDRCVVLIDEIDELVQKRGKEAQQLSRFFTTTMLPRLSKLWSAGRVLFFANTNSIQDVDPAIKRSGRFDAAIFVLPPGPEAKRKTLLNGEPKIDIPDEIWTIAQQAIDGEGGADKEIGWLALIRHDQLPSFAKAIEVANKGHDTVNQATVKSAVEDVKNDLLRNDWWAESQGKSKAPSELVAEIRSSQRREQRLLPVVEFVGEQLDGAERLVIGQPFWRFGGTPPQDLEKLSIDGFRMRSNGVLEPTTSVNPTDPPSAVDPDSGAHDQKPQE
jgi:hypothetical protein